MNRREFLKIMLGTAPAFHFTNSLASMWNTDNEKRMVSDPSLIFIDDSGYLYDPDFEPDFISVREYYDVDFMDAKSRLEFYVDRFGEEYLQVLLQEEDTDEVFLSADQVEELDSCLDHYLAEELDSEEGSFRQQMDNSQYWIGGWLYDNLPADAFNRLKLYYEEGEFPGSSFCGVGFKGNTDQLNAVLYSCGLNAICLKE